MIRALLFAALTIPLIAQPVPLKTPAETVSTAPIVKTPAEERRETLKKLVNAGVLLLEAHAYRQFILAFVEEEDRKRFEQAYSKNGPVDYDTWGREKGVQMLKVLRFVAAIEPIATPTHACYVSADLPRGKLSFIFIKDSWFIENKSSCPGESAAQP